VKRQDRMNVLNEIQYQQQLLQQQSDNYNKAQSFANRYLTRMASRWRLLLLVGIRVLCLDGVQLRRQHVQAIANTREIRMRTCGSDLFGSDNTASRHSPTIRELFLLLLQILLLSRQLLLLSLNLIALACQFEFALVDIGHRSSGSSRRRRRSGRRRTLLRSGCRSRC
jgi:hypothetical protein